MGMTIEKAGTTTVATQPAETPAEQKKKTKQSVFTEQKEVTIHDLISDSKLQEVLQERRNEFSYFNYCKKEKYHDGKIAAGIIGGILTTFSSVVARFEWGTKKAALVGVPLAALTAGAVFLIDRLENNKEKQLNERYDALLSERIQEAGAKQHQKEYSKAEAEKIMAAVIKEYDKVAEQKEKEAMKAEYEAYMAEMEKCNSTGCRQAGYIRQQRGVDATTKTLGTYSVASLGLLGLLFLL